MTNQTTEGIRIDQLIHGLLREGHTRAVIDDAIRDVVQLDREAMWKCEDGSDLPTARGLTLPQDGLGWQLTEEEASSLLDLVREAEPACEACGQPRPEDRA